MGRLLGIDYGKKRVGLALSDPLGIFATGLETLPNTSLKQLIRALQQVITAHEVETLVLGLPLKQSGELGDAALGVQAFGAALEEATGLPLHYVDERFTSTIAQQSLREQGVKPSLNKGLVDKTAAALILQSFMDRR